MDSPSPSSLYNDLSIPSGDYQLFLSSNSDPNLQNHNQPSTQTEATSIHEGTNLETHNYDRVIPNRFFNPLPLLMSNEEYQQIYELQHIDVPRHQSGQLKKLNKKPCTYNRNDTIEAPTLHFVSPTDLLLKPELVGGITASTFVDRAESIMSTLSHFNSTAPNPPEQPTISRRFVISFYS